ncbi:MAG: 1-phosphofructokinase [Clostridiales bacterium]|nr:1-phosphofructokinase [Clostridiales bacterium]
MIYTVTFNPALDYVIDVDELQNGMVNRTKNEKVFCGGKGINVSIVLKTLGVDSKALGFVAGFTGKEIEDRVKKAGVIADFISLKDGISRINVKIRSHAETELNAQGPKILKEDIDSFFHKLDAIMDGDLLILAGSIPSSLPSNLYEKIMEYLQAKQVKIVVDATKDLLKNVLKYHPFLIKPNHHELAELFDATIQSKEDVIRYAKMLQKMGAVNVLVSMGAEGAILVDEFEQVHSIGTPSGNAKYCVGAGDSMVAGFIAGYLMDGTYDTALRFGAAAGSATAFSEGLATKEMIEECIGQILLGNI